MTNAESLPLDSNGQMDPDVARWNANVAMWMTREGIARKRLSFHEDRDHTLGVEERRRMVRDINEAQDERERAEYMLRRAIVAVRFK